MFRIIAIALFLLASCAAPVRHGDIDERLSYWNADLKRFMHMHSSESELRDWLGQRGVKISIPAQGPEFIALLESIQESGHMCPTDIYLVGEIKGASVLWYRVEAMKRSDCQEPLST